MTLMRTGLYGKCADLAENFMVGLIIDAEIITYGVKA